VARFAFIFFFTLPEEWPRYAVLRAGQGLVGHQSLSRPFVPPADVLLLFFFQWVCACRDEVLSFVRKA
jgi:hypothetical protein